MGLGMYICELLTTPKMTADIYAHHLIMHTFQILAMAGVKAAWIKPIFKTAQAWVVMNFALDGCYSLYYFSARLGCTGTLHRALYFSLVLGCLSSAAYFLVLARQARKEGERSLACLFGSMGFLWLVWLRKTVAKGCVSATRGVLIPAQM